MSDMDKLRASGAVKTVGEIVDSNAASQRVELLGMIERAVRDPAIDIDKMERLLAMQERAMAESSRRAFNTAFRLAKAEMKPVVRNKYNEQTRSGYANLEAVADALDPIIDRHEFVLTFGTDKSDLDGHYRVTCDVLHDEGYERHYHADVPADNVGMKGNQNKTATHGFGSTMSYGRRYLKLMIFDVATTDDNDGQRKRDEPDYEMISSSQCGELRRLIAQVEATEEAFCDYLRVGTLPELAAKNFEVAKGVLVKRIAAMKAAK